MVSAHDRIMGTHRRGGWWASSIIGCPGVETLVAGNLDWA